MKMKLRTDVLVSDFACILNSVSSIILLDGIQSSSTTMQVDSANTVDSSMTTAPVKVPPTASTSHNDPDGEDDEEDQVDLAHIQSFAEYVVEQVDTARCIAKIAARCSIFQAITECR